MGQATSTDDTATQEPHSPTKHIDPIPSSPRTPKGHKENTPNVFTPTPSADDRALQSQTPENRSPLSNQRQQQTTQENSPLRGNQTPRNDHEAKENTQELPLAPEATSPQLSDIASRVQIRRFLCLESGEYQLVKRLDLRELGLTCLPLGMSILNNLTHLDVRQNKLTALDPAINQLNQLLELFLSNNKIEILEGEHIQGLSSVQVFEAAFNRLKELPSQFGCLSQLTRLHLTQNRLTALPDSIGSLQLLQEMYFGNSLSKSADLGRALEPGSDQAQALLTVGRPSKSGNRLSCLPSSVSNLTNLSVLVAMHNCLSTISDGFSNLTALRRLNLKNNHLTSVTPSLGALPNLERVELTGNALSDAEMLVWSAFRPKVAAVDLSGYKLTILAEPSILLMSGIGCQALYLPHNSLSYLPPSIGLLTTLTSLDLSHNCLTGLPPSLGLIPNLKELKLEENPLPPSMHRLVARGVPVLLRFFRKTLQGSEVSPRSRAFLLGPPQSGKSDLAKALTSSVFPGRSQGAVYTSQDGIFTIYPQPIVMGRTPPVSIWELCCANQSNVLLSHLVHPSSFIILIWDSAHTLLSWLSFFCAVAPGSTILLVTINQSSTKSGSRSFSRGAGTPNTSLNSSFQDAEPIQPDLTRFASHINTIPSVHVDPFSRYRVARLRSLIAYHMDQHLAATFSTKVPRLHLRMAEYISHIRRTSDPPVVSMQEFVNHFVHLNPSRLNLESMISVITSASRPTETVTSMDAAIYLRSTGDVIWIPDRACLQSLGHLVCDPKMLCSFWTQMFGPLRSLRDIGAYRLRDLTKDLDQRYPNQADLILDMFRSFKLSFPIHTGHELFPSLLPAGLPPTYLWPYLYFQQAQRHITIALQLNWNVLPFGFFSRVVCEMSPLFDSNSPADRFFCSSTHCVFDIAPNVQASGTRLHGEGHEPHVDPKSPIKITDSKRSSSDFTGSQVCINHGLNSHDSIMYVTIRTVGSEEEHLESVHRVLEKVSLVQEAYTGLVVEQHILCPSCVTQQYLPSECGRVSFTHTFESNESVVCVPNNHPIEWRLWINGVHLQQTPLFSSTQTTSSSPSKPKRRHQTKSLSNYDDAPILVWIDDSVESGFSYSECVCESETNSSEWRLHLVCDRPFSPHPTLHPGYDLPANKEWMHDFGLQVSASLEMHRYVSTQAAVPNTQTAPEDAQESTTASPVRDQTNPQTPHGTPTKSEPPKSPNRQKRPLTSFEYDTCERVQKKFKQQRQLYLPSTHKLREKADAQVKRGFHIHTLLEELDPQQEWSKYVDLIHLPNGEARWMCHSCQKQFATLGHSGRILSSHLGKTGWMWKLSQRTWKKWHRRFFELHFGRRVLMRHKSEDSKQDPKVVDLSAGFEIRDMGSRDDMFCFAIQLRDESIIKLKVETFQEKNEWMRQLSALREAVSQRPSVTIANKTPSIYHLASSPYS